MSETDHTGISAEEMEQIRAEAMDFAGIGLYRYRFDGTIVFIDRGALKILDLDAEYPDPGVLVGRNIAELIEYRGPRGRLRQTVREKGHIRDFQYPFRTLTGQDRWALHDSYLIRSTDGEEDLIQVIIRDITELKSAQEALDAERERLAVTMRSIGDGVISTDVDGVVVLINAEAERLTGWPRGQAVGKPLTEVFHIVNERTRKKVESPVDKVLEQGIVVGLANHTVLVARNGVERAIANSGAPIRDPQNNIIGVVLVFRDVSRERVIEESRRRADKMESIGLLAGGIAHDFNNYLTAILGNISLAKSHLAAETRDDDIVEMLEDAEESSQLARGLTEQLLTFAKGGAPVKRPVPLPNLLKRSAEFALSGSSVELRLSTAADLHCPDADPGQISQVIDNLVINAKQAMPSGGVLEIRADNVDDRAPSEHGLPPGRYVRIMVRDHGTGIQHQYLDRIFEPYFTTKQEGSGLGLATTLSIINRHDGHIHVDSELGEGTTFYVYLPASEDAPPEQAGEPHPKGPRRALILLMDDKDIVLRSCRRQLASLGHEAVCTKDGEAAVLEYARALESGKPFDAVLLDLTVPGGMGGVQTLEKLKEIDPEVKAIASSGYSHNPVMAEYESYGFRAVVVKPYTADALASVLCRLLSDGDTRA